MTVLLCHKDSYITHFNAKVTAVVTGGVILDQTAFFPGGGGQPPDRGSLTISGSVRPVVGLRRQGDDIVHLLDSALPEVGAEVDGDIDWSFRFRMMRTHTALHALCGVIWREFAAQVTGGQMYEDRARMDFSLEEFGPDRVRHIEDRVNQELASGRKVQVRFLPRAEAFEIPDLIRTKVNLLPPEIEIIRIIDIVGLDQQADGGTHVANTREVGQVRIVKTENKGKQNKRIEIVLDPA